MENCAVTAVDRVLSADSLNHIDHFRRVGWHVDKSADTGTRTQLGQKCRTCPATLALISGYGGTLEIARTGEIRRVITPRQGTVRSFADPSIGLFRAERVHLVGVHLYPASEPCRLGCVDFPTDFGTPYFRDDFESFSSSASFLLDQVSLWHEADATASRRSFDLGFPSRRKVRRRAAIVGDSS